MIRLAELHELDAIMEIFAAARKYMADSGNPSQWGNTHPPRDMIEDDIKNRQLYVCEKDGEIHSVFAFIIGPDETYRYIEGAWKNDEPYGTIHRIASSGKVKGVFSECIEFCKSKINNLRIDTHENNRTMLHLVAKHGFERCGVIYIHDGTPRIAFQYTRQE